MYSINSIIIKCITIIMNTNFNKYGNKQEILQANSFCERHPHNLTYKYCENCQKCVCDKCIREEHLSHKTVEITNDVQSNRYIVQLLKNFKIETSKKVEVIAQSFKNMLSGNNQSKNDLNSKKKMITKYFEDELELIKRHTNMLKKTLEDFQNEIIELVVLYKAKFFELFGTLHNNYSSLVNSINECILLFNFI